MQHRALRPTGVFVALWNLRYIEANPVLAEIEAEIAPRVSGGLQRIESKRR
jgi:hypothetical protein